MVKREEREEPELKSTDSYTSKPEPANDPGFPMTSYELQKAIDERTQDFNLKWPKNDRPRKHDQIPQNTLRNMRKTMADEDPSDDQLDDDFLEGIRGDIAEWETTDNLVERGLPDEEEKPLGAGIPSELRTPDDAGALPDTDVPVDDTTKHMPQ